MRTRSPLAPAFLLGAMSALLAGCPVWGPEPGGGVVPIGDGGVRPDGARPDSGLPPTSCARNEECPAGEYCEPITGTCVVTPGCMRLEDCPSGYYCDARSACVPGCRATSDCAALGAGLSCNTSTRRCEPSGQCTADRDCSGGELCVSGSCRAPAAVCRFNYQCGAGQECLDGRCVATCRAGAPAGMGGCPDGQVCQGGFCQAPPASGCGSCASNEVCSNNQCVPACANDAACGAGYFCDRGACRIDDRRPAPFCTPPSTGCAAGSLCIDGVCRIACPGATNDECQRRDVNFTTCDAMRICRYSNEQNPQCSRSAECPSGQACVNALCRPAG